MNQDFQGNQYEAGTVEYKEHVGQYATSTYGVQRNLNPAAILQPLSMQDIQAVVGNAIKQNRPIAIRTGGHQYSGASSCGPDGIQLDLKPTFRRPGIDLNVSRENGKMYLNTSVSWTLKEVFQFLKQNGIFMPTGQCINVCLGGHLQTGGYGMLARSFGLLGDYIRELTIVDYSAEVVTVTKDSQPDLFYGLLGGCPGNLGVVTHAKIEVQEDVSHQGSQGQFMAFHYTKKNYHALLDLLVEKSEDPNFPRGYDMTVNVLDKTFDLTSIFPGTNDELQKKINDQLPERDDGSEEGEDLDIFKWAFPLIVVYAQWVAIPGEAPFSTNLFDKIRSIPDTWFKLVRSTVDDPKPMSEIASWWLFEQNREFPYPYVKRTNTTKESDLGKRKWSAWFAERMTEAINTKSLFVSSQLQVFGPGSMFQKNAGQGTSFCFRDATMGGTWDVFYKGSRQPADAWQDHNDAGMQTYFSPTDRRVLWGSYGEWDMKRSGICTMTSQRT
jgi:hypothetical protein